MLFWNPLYRAVSLLLACLAITNGSTCVYDTCTCEYSIASCSDLSSIPPLTADSGQLNITYLLFYTGNITEVGDNSLPPNLSAIQFTANPITSISRNAFLASSNTLNNLLFSETRFPKLPDAILGLQSLTSLAVHDTTIVDWNLNVLQHLSKTLSSLNVDNLTIWPDWLSYLTSLQAIYISDSDLSQIPDDAFVNVIDKLHVLNLIRVNLSAVPKAISHLNLTSLSLSGNRLSDISGVPVANHMDLSSNVISDSDKLVAALLPLGARIQTLYLDSNNLTVIPDLENVDIERLIISNNHISDHIKGSLPQSLIELSLSGNRLTLVPTVVANLPNVKTIDLSSNLISNISTTLVDPNLEQLFLGNNQISQILQSDFPVGSSLQFLDLASNPLTDLSPDAFNNLQSLTELRLDNTKLTSVPLFLTFLAKLETLSMEGIPSLNCSCPRDDSLVKWFSSGVLQDTSGTCSSGVTIEDFYSGQDQTECEK